MKDHLPKISIVTPSFNQADYLEFTIKSVLDQKYPNLEYIIIDGGSKDGSIEIIQKYANKLHFWISETDKGLYNALNKGFSHATGDIMGWINSDDMYHPNALFTVAEIFSNLNEVNWLEGTATFYDEQNRTVAAQPAPKRSLLDFLAGNYRWIQQESTFWTRSLWHRAGGLLNENYKLAGDFDLWLRFFQQEKLYSTHALIGGFRMRSKNQLSLEQMESYEKEVELILAQFPKNSKLSDDLSSLRKLQKLSKKLARSRVLNLASLQQRIQKRQSVLHAYPPTIYFDRIQQKFLLE
jgi:glycosyltransferase involved in cell wall biosynthesis